MQLQDKKPYGYLTYALNYDIDYESIALLWAYSVRRTHVKCPALAVIVNDAKQCRKELHDVFDYVIRFEPTPPEPPHTEEDHHEIASYNEKLQELVKKEKRCRQ